VINYIMSEKGFEAEIGIDETPINLANAEKPLKDNDKKKNRVDINVLKSKLQENENKEFRKNMSIFIFFLIFIGTAGIYLST